MPRKTPTADKNLDAPVARVELWMTTQGGQKVRRLAWKVLVEALGQQNATLYCLALAGNDYRLARRGWSDTTLDETVAEMEEQEAQQRKDSHAPHTRRTSTRKNRS